MFFLILFFNIEFSTFNSTTHTRRFPRKFISYFHMRWKEKLKYATLEEKEFVLVSFSRWVLYCIFHIKFSFIGPPTTSSQLALQTRWTGVSCTEAKLVVCPVKPFSSGNNALYETWLVDVVSSYWGIKFIP